MKDITFGEVLKELRNKSGLSRKKFAERIGENEHTFRGWESGKHSPMPSTRKNILRRSQKIANIGTNDRFINPITDPEDIKRLFNDIDAGTTGEREPVPYNLLIAALNQHCPPSVSIKLLDSIRGDMGW